MKLFGDILIQLIIKDNSAIQVGGAKLQIVNRIVIKTLIFSWFSKAFKKFIDFREKGEIEKH